MNKILQNLLISTLAVAPAWGASFTAASELGNTNPSGVWSYGYAVPTGIGMLSSAFTLMPTFTFGSNGGGGLANSWTGDNAVTGGAVVANTTTTFDPFVFGYLLMHPGNSGQLAIVAFTAPSAGSYSFSGEFASHGGPRGNGVDVSAVLGGGTFRLNTTVMPASSGPVLINFTQALTLGQSVYFTLGANGEFSFDATGLKLVVTDGQSGSPIPEPSSVILLGLGAAVLWMKRRSL